MSETVTITLTAPEELSAAQRLLAYVERLERLAIDAKELAGLRKDLLAELKSAGFDAPTVQALVKRRSRKAEEVVNADRLLAHYSDAIAAPSAFSASSL